MKLKERTHTSTPVDRSRYNKSTTLCRMIHHDGDAIKTWHARVLNVYITTSVQTRRKQIIPVNDEWAHTVTPLPQHTRKKKETKTKWGTFEETKRQVGVAEDARKHHANLPRNLGAFTQPHLSRLPRRRPKNTLIIWQHNMTDKQKKERQQTTKGYEPCRIREVT